MRPDLEAVLRIGQEMSNVFYNITQRPEAAADYFARDDVKGMHKRWDEAARALRALESRAGSEGERIRVTVDREHHAEVEISPHLGVSLDILTQAFAAALKQQAKARALREIPPAPADAPEAEPRKWPDETLYLGKEIGPFTHLLAEYQSGHDEAVGGEGCECKLCKQYGRLNWSLFLPPSEHPQHAAMEAKRRAVELGLAAAPRESAPSSLPLDLEASKCRHELAAVVHEPDGKDWFKALVSCPCGAKGSAWCYHTDDEAGKSNAQTEAWLSWYKLRPKPVDSPTLEDATVIWEGGHGMVQVAIDAARGLLYGRPDRRELWTLLAHLAPDASWPTGRFTSEFALYNMLMAWTPEQCREFYAMLSRRPDFNPVAPTEPNLFLDAPAPSGTADCERHGEFTAADGCAGCIQEAQDAISVEPLGLGAGKIIRGFILQHKHNVTRNDWESLSPGQQESWRIVAEQVARRLRGQEAAS